MGHDLQQIQRMRFGILKKFIAGFLLLSLVPLVLLSLFTWVRMNRTVEGLLDSSRHALTETSMSLLQARAGAIAAQVEQFLMASAEDLNTIAALPPDPELYLRFSRVHQRRIWIPGPDPIDEKGIRPVIPLYIGLSFIRPDGYEIIRIREGRLIPGLRDFNGPVTGPWGREHFFQRTMAQDSDTPFVSHLMGYHVARPDPPAQKDRHPDQETLDIRLSPPFSGVIRFSRQVYRDGTLLGVVSLALDHRHLMAFTQHVQPFGNDTVLLPDYFSGNYAFMFDDQGWMITHPKPWDIRGVDPLHRLPDPASPAYMESDIKTGKLPFNLLHVPFIHENYQTIARHVIEGRSGVRQTASVGGVSRVLAYAPIRFDLGEYTATGYFGGVALGVQTDQFHLPVKKTAETIHRMLARTAGSYLLLILATGIAVALIAVFLSRSFTRPIRLLTRRMEEISRGNYDAAVPIRTGDEMEILGLEFSRMGRRLKENEQRLISSLKNLEQHTAMLSSIFANMLSGLVLFSQQGGILSANPKASEFFNIPQDQMTGLDIRHLLAPYPDWLAWINDNNNTHAPSGTTTLEMALPDNQRLYLETAVSRLQDTGPENLTPSTLLIFRDITRRKRMEHHIARSGKLVSLGILAAGIAHEIRNPLTGITLMLDDLHDRIANRTSDCLLIQRSLEEIEKLENIVNRLLDFAKKPGHQSRLEDINQVVEDTLFFVSKQCRRQGVTITRKPARDLPRCQMDRERIRQAIINIVLNALNVLEPGGTITITTAMDPHADPPALLLSIADNGPGIASEELDLIFDPFFSHNPEGFGLGLSITHTIVEEHGGRITVQSEPGRGACFTLHLPVPGHPSGAPGRA